MPFLTPNKKDGLTTRLFSIPPDMVPYLRGAISVLANFRAWEGFGDRTPKECADIWEDVLANMTGLPIGTIFPTVGDSSVLPAGCLWCDGGEFSPVEYPLLAQVWELQALGPDLFGKYYLPDLNGQERFLMGSAFPGSVGGEKEHTLTIDEMPAHDHGTHIHPPGQATGEIPTPIPDMPVPDPLGSRGGGLPHNNLPPYYGVSFYIVAG